MDPYKVLGLSPGASQDEIKAAYRRLAKQYHPDINPSADAEAKMKEINEAYAVLIKGKTPSSSGSSSQSSYGSGTGYGSSGGYNTSGGYGSYGPFGGFDPFGFGGYSRGYSQTNESPQFVHVRNLINAGRFREAVDALDSISGRSARWYFLSAVANEGLGNHILALDHARRAAAMEPNNPEYQQYAYTLQNGGERYETTGRHYGFPGLNCNPCVCLCLASYCCGGRIPFFFCC